MQVPAPFPNVSLHSPVAMLWQRSAFKECDLWGISCLHMDTRFFMISGLIRWWTPKYCYTKLWDPTIFSRKWVTKCLCVKYQNKNFILSENSIIAADHKPLVVHVCGNQCYSQGLNDLSTTKFKKYFRSNLMMKKIHYWKSLPMCNCVSPAVCFDLYSKDLQPCCLNYSWYWLNGWSGTCYLHIDLFCMEII